MSTTRFTFEVSLNWEGRSLSLSGFELFGCQKSLVVVQAAVKFVGDEAKIICAGGMERGGSGFSFLIVGNILFLFQCCH